MYIKCINEKYIAENNNGVLIYYVEPHREDSSVSIYDFKVKNIYGEEISMGQYEGKVLLIVNTASK
jgi:hypothetical protein